MTQDLLAFGLSCGFAGFMLSRVWNFLKRVWIYSPYYSSFQDIERYGLVPVLQDWFGLSMRWFNPSFGEPKGILRYL